MINDQRHTFPEEQSNVATNESNTVIFSENAGKHRTSQAFKIAPQSQLANDEVDLSVLEQELQQLQDELVEMQILLNHVLNQNSNEVKPFKTLVLNGIVQIQNGGQFSTVTADRINGDSTKEILEDLVRYDDIKTQMIILSLLLILSLISLFLLFSSKYLLKRFICSQFTDLILLRMQ